MRRIQFTWNWVRQLGMWVKFHPSLSLASSGEGLAKNPSLRKVENPVYRFPEQVFLLYLFTKAFDTPLNYLCPVALHDVPTKFMPIFKIFRIFLVRGILCI